MAHEIAYRGIVGGRLDRYTPGKPAWARVILFLGTGGYGNPGGPYRNLISALIGLGYEVWVITLPGDGDEEGGRPWLLEDYVHLATYVIDQKSELPTFVLAVSAGTLGAEFFLASTGQGVIKAAAMHNVALPGTLELATFSRIAGVLPKPKWVLAMERWLVGKVARLAPDLQIPKALYLPKWQEIFGKDWRSFVSDPLFRKKIAVKSLESMLCTYIDPELVRTPIRALAPTKEISRGRQEEILERCGLTSAESYSVDGDHAMPFNPEGASRIAIAAHQFFLEHSHTHTDQRS